MHGAAPQRITTPTHPLAFAAAAGANVALAFGPWFVRLANTDALVGPVAAGFWRIALAAPLLCAAALMSGGMSGGTSARMNGGAGPIRSDRGVLLLVAIGGVCFAADLGSWHIGILRTTLANATLFGNCATLIFPIYGFLIARAWPSRTQGLALLLAFAGAALLMGRSYQLDPRNLAGDLFCVLAGLLYTAYFIAMARARASMGSLPALALSTLASVLPLLLLALALGERIVPTTWGPLIGLALVSQVLGQGLMIYALGQLSPLVIGVALLIQPVVAATIGWIAYGERLTPPDLVGVAMVAAALVLVRLGGTVERARGGPTLGKEEAA